MSEQGYRPRHNISRQFTESELAVSDRATEHLTQQVDTMPAPKLSRYGTADEAYGWLEQDLKRRDEATTRLAREMQLAEAQSLRQQLDVEARQDADRKTKAADAISSVAKWKEAGFGSPAEAKQAALTKDPALASIPEFNEGFANFTKDYKSKEQLEMDELSLKSDLIREKLDLGGLDFIAKSFEGHPEKEQAFYQSVYDVRVIGTMEEAEQLNLRRAAARMGVENTTRNMDFFNMAEGGSQSTLIDQMAAYQKVGMNINNPGRLQSRFKPGDPQLEMTLNPAYLARIPAEKKAELESNLNILTNPKATEDELEAAQSFVNQVTVEYTQDPDIMAARDWQRKQAAISKKLPEAAGAVKEQIKANQTILKGYAENPQADPTIPVGAMVSNTKQTMSLIKLELTDKGVDLTPFSEAVVELDRLYKKAEDRAKTGFYDLNVVSGKEGDPKQEKVRREHVNSFAQQINDVIAGLLEKSMAAPRVTDETPDPTGSAGKADEGKSKKTTVSEKVLDQATLDALRSEHGTDREALNKAIKAQGFTKQAPGLK